MVLFHIILSPFWLLGGFRPPSFKGPSSLAHLIPITVNMSTANGGGHEGSGAIDENTWRCGGFMPPQRLEILTFFQIPWGSQMIPPNCQLHIGQAKGRGGRHSSHTAALRGAAARGPRTPGAAWLPPTLEIGPLRFLASTPAELPSAGAAAESRPAHVCMPALGQGAGPTRTVAIPTLHPRKEIRLLTSAHIHQAESRDPSQSLGSLGAPRSGPAREKRG